MQSGAMGAIAAMLLAAPVVRADPYFWPGNGHYHELISAPESLTWHDAMADSASRTWMGVTGHLVAVNSLDEFNAVFAFNQALPDRMWAGGFQAEGSASVLDGWQWVTAETWGYSNWRLGQPDDELGDERFLMLVYNADQPQFPTAEDIYYWHDALPDSPVHGYVVEYPVPTPAAAPWLTVWLVAISSNGRRP